MQVKDIVNSIGDFFLWTFEILPTLGNLPNILFLAIGSILFLYWMGQMRAHSKRGER